MTVAGEATQALTGAGTACPYTASAAGGDGVVRFTFRRISGTGAYDLRTAGDTTTASAKYVDSDTAYATAELTAASAAGLRLYVPASTSVRVTAEIAGGWEAA